MGANLSVTKSASPSTITAGQAVTYTIVVTNPSTDTDAVDVTIIDTNIIPNSTITNVTVVPPEGTQIVGQTVLIDIGDIAAGDSVTVTITVQTTSQTPNGIYTNTAVVTSALAEPITATATVNVSTSPGVQNLTLRALPCNISCGITTLGLLASVISPLPNTSVVFTVSPVGAAIVNPNISPLNANGQALATYQSSGFIGTVVVTARETGSNRTAQLTIEHLPNCCVRII